MTDDSKVRRLQRRHLTIMLVDLVDSTRLSRTMGEEQFVHACMRYQDVVEAASARFRGSVVRVIGDEVMVLFGVPAANEMDAERALRAAARIHADLAELEDPAGLRCRIGISSGVTVVGDMPVGQAVQRDSLFGSLPSLARRLQKLAEPGETVASAETRDLAGATMAFDDLGVHEMQGFDDPEPAFRLIGEAPETPIPAANSDLVGRAQEMAALEAAWARACAGEGGAMAVIGEPGMGKSRLVAELSGRHPEAEVVVYQCSPFHADTPLHPFRSQIEIWCGLSGRESVRSRRRKLDAAFAPLVAPGSMPVIYGLVAPGEGEARPADEAEQRRLLRGVFAEVIASLSAEKPVLLLFEDLHWADPSTLALLRASLRALKDRRALMLLTSRSGAEGAALNGDGRLRAAPDAPALLLGPLGDEDALELAAAADVKAADAAAGKGGGGRLDPRVTADIVAKSGGVPLFLEACVAAMRAPGAAGREIPAAIHDLLGQELDAAGPHRDAAIQASVLGRAFDVPSLAHVSGRSEAETEDAVAALAGLRIVERARGDAVDLGERRWRFRHALVREAAYERLMESPRKALHRRAAEMYAGRAEAQDSPEIVARHWELGGAPDAAVPAYVDAARLHLRRHANAEGARLAARGLALLDALPEAGRGAAELELQFLRGASARVAHGYAAEETVAAFERAFELAEAQGDRKMSVRVGRGLFTAALVKADYAGAEGWGARMLAGTNDTHGRMVGHYIRGFSLAPQGRFAEAARALEDAAEEAARHQREAASEEVDEAAVIQIEATRALVDGFRGRDRLALARAERAVARAEALDQPLTLVNALQWATEVHMQHDTAEYRAMAAKLLMAAQATASPYFMAVAAAHHAGAAIRNGGAERGVAQLEAGWKGMQDTGADAYGLLINVELARGLRALGRRAEGLDAVERALQLADRTGERCYEAEALRLRGLMRQEGGDREGGLSDLRAAVQVAQDQDGGLQERAALADLARLGAATGPEEARLAELTARAETAPPEAMPAPGAGLPAAPPPGF